MRGSFGIGLRGAAVVALLWSAFAGMALAQTFSISGEAPVTVAAGNSFQARMAFAVSGSNAIGVVAWLESDTSLAQDFGQSEDLAFLNASSGGAFTATAIEVAGVAIPAGSVYWQLEQVNAGIALVLTANLRAPNGSLAGTTHTLQAHVQAGAAGASAAPTVTAVSAQPRPAASMQFGEGWFLIGSQAMANPGSTVQFAAQAGNGSPAGTETLYQARAWVALDPLCAAIGEATADCLARVGDVSDGGSVEIAFDPDGEGGLPAAPAVVWSLGAIVPGANVTRTFRFDLPEGTTDPTFFTLATRQDSARSGAVTATREFRIGIPNTPSLAYALGKRIRGVSAISPGNDLPGMSVAFEEPFALLARVGNTGASGLGDIVQFVRVPESLHFVDGYLPPGTGRVFYSLDESFTDPNAPPPADLSATIGNAVVPEDIDTAGNDYWRALDAEPPVDPSAVRWVAIYATALASAFFPEPGVPNSVVGEVSMKAAQAVCANTQASLRMTGSIFSFTPVNGSEIAIPTPPSIGDTEPVTLGGSAPAINLTASGASSATAGSGTPAQVGFMLSNLGSVALDDVPIVLTWPALSINGVLAYPEFVSATGGTVDASLADQGEVVVSVGPIAAGASRSVTLSLRYPAGIVAGATHPIRADVFVAGGPCADATASATRSLSLSGSPFLQLSTAADQAALESGAELSFTGRHRNAGNAVATGAFVYGPVPPNTALRRAELPPQRRLLCSGPPLDASLPTDPLAFTAATFAGLFVPGIETGDGWTCPQGGATSWIALALDDPALTPSSFVTGADETWRLYLVNDEVRDEPDVVQQGSPAGTVIPFELAILANGLLPARSNLSTSVVIDETTPLAELALGDDVGGTLAITPGANDNPDASVAPDGSFELGIRLDNLGIATLGDVVHFLRVPEALRFQGASLPEGIAGRVFYSTDTGFADPEVPPPVDLSAAIGNAALPEDIDADGNDIWQALDATPPPDLSAVRWVALYLASLPAAAPPALSRVALQSAQPGCTDSTAVLHAPTQVFSTTPPDGSEAAATLALSDAEPVRLAGATFAVALAASGPDEVVVGSGTPTTFEFLVENPGTASLDAAELTVNWSPLWIGDSSIYPEFVGADGGTVDASGAEFGQVRIALDAIAPGAGELATLSLRYPAGVFEGDTHYIQGQTVADGGACGSVFGFDFAAVTLRGADLQASTAADQVTLAPGGELSFSGRHANAGTASVYEALVLARVPAHTSFLRAELPPGNALLCSATPPEQDPFENPQFQFGEQVGSDWFCPQGGATNWIIVILYDPFEGPLAFPPGQDDTWRLHLRNDEIRDEPDVEQQPSPDGTEIAFELTLLAYGMAPVQSNVSIATVSSAPTALTLSASGDPVIAIEPESTLLIRSFVLGNACTATLPQPTLALDWPSLSINGVPARPDFVAASGGAVDDENAASGAIGIAFDPIAPGAQATATLTLRYPPGIVDGATHTVFAEAFAAGGACDGASASASHVVQLLGSPALGVEATADQETLAPGGDLSFTSQHRNTGTAVATAAFAWAEVPAETVFRRADLPPPRRLLCGAPPEDALLPADPADFDAATFATLFAPGIDTGDGWTCPQGGTTSWIALALDDANLDPPSFVLGPAESWTLHLRNDRIRDEPDDMQEPSPDGTLIVFAPYIGAGGVPATSAEPAVSTVVDILPFGAVCQPPLLTNRDRLDYTIPTFNGVAPLSFELVAGELPGCVTLDSEGRLRGGSNEVGEAEATLLIIDGKARQVEVVCAFRVIEAGIFIDSFEAKPSTPAPYVPPCP